MDLGQDRLGKVRTGQERSIQVSKDEQDNIRTDQDRSGGASHHNINQNTDLKKLRFVLIVISIVDILQIHNLFFTELHTLSPI